MLRILALLFLTIATWVVTVLHMACLPATDPSLESVDSKALESIYLPKNDRDLNHLLLYGSSYQRGYAAGKLTKNLLAETEELLFSEFERFFPNPILRWSFIIGAMRYFAGSDAYIPQWVKSEALGIAQHSDHRFDYILDPYTLAVAFHGIHEVGQLFVDFEKDDFACTVLAAKYRDSWIIGRNFDFEIVRYFDNNKILKWHFPTDGYAFLSVIWPGMLGTVTGVNEHGVYISINAAGSKDYRHLGTPTTLLVTEALTRSKDAKEAIEFLRNADVFVTDIYVIADRTHSFKVEKSPLATEVEEMQDNTAVANHLTSKRFASDSINEFRRDELTSAYRLNRANEILVDLKRKNLSKSKDVELGILSGLRDKKGPEGEHLHLGNKRAIDALIASHSVIYNAHDQILYVSKGPALVGEFFGFDLKPSFAKRHPIKSSYNLPKDPDIDEELFAKVKESLRMTSVAESSIRAKKCDKASVELQKASGLFSESSNYYIALGKFNMTCEGNAAVAKENWTRALKLRPAYKSQIKFLEQQKI